MWRHQIFIFLTFKFAVQKNNFFVDANIQLAHSNLLHTGVENINMANSLIAI